MEPSHFRPLKQRVFFSISTELRETTDPNAIQFWMMINPYFKTDGS